MTIVVFFHPFEELNVKVTQLSLTQLAMQVKRICPIATLSRHIDVPVLISASQDDDRVPFCGILKWLERARSFDPRGDRVVVNETDGGHFGYQADLPSLIAKEYAFILEHLRL